MGDVFHPIPGFTGGVSQQSPVMRLDTQCELSDNTHATVAEGLMKRPNCDFVKLLGGLASSSGRFVHRIIRDQDEKYIVVFCNNATTPIYVFDLEGNAQTVRYGHLDADLNYTADNTVKSYLTSGITDCKTQIKAISVADYTIVANTQKTCALLSSQSAARHDVAYAWFKRRVDGAYKIIVHYKVSGVLQSFSAEYTGESSGSPDTNGLCDWFLTELNTADTNDYFWFGSENNVLMIQPAEGTPVDALSLYITTEDPYGGEGLIAINKCEIQSMDKLPNSLNRVVFVAGGYRTEDVKIKIHGKQEEKQDDYYLQYNSETRVWRESVGFEQLYAIDEDTMPHRLVRTDVGEFTFAPCLWEDRRVGDEDTNLTPSFIDNKISNLRFHKNRLWFFSRENSVGSKVGEYFNFFRSTVLNVLDDDPIDEAAAGEKVTNIRASKGFDKGLLLISDEEQFVLTAGDQGMTPGSVAVDSATDYSADPNSDPVKIGPDVYFVSPKGRYLGLRQYTIMPDTLIQDAYDVTSHVPRYIPKGTSSVMDGCNQLDMIFLWTQAATNDLYVHQFLWDGNSKVQQAWYRWRFNYEVVGFKVFGTTLYILFYSSTNGVILEKIELESIPFEDGVDDQPFRFHIDHMTKLTGGTFGGVNTTFTLPINIGTGTGWIVIDGADQSQLASGYTLSNTTLSVTGDVSSKTYFVGRKFTMTHRLSEWYARDADQRALIAGTLQIRELTLAFKDSGAFEVQVTALGRSTMEAEEMSGLRIGESIIGQATLLTGEKTFRIMANSKGTTVDIVSDSYLPVSIQMGQWFGTHTMKGTPI